MELNAEQLDRMERCLASAKRLSGASDAEVVAARNNILNNLNAGFGIYYRPHGAAPGIASTLSMNANGNSSIRFNGAGLGGTFATFGFSIPAGG